MRNFERDKGFATRQLMVTNQNMPRKILTLLRTSEKEL